MLPIEGYTAFYPLRRCVCAVRARCDGKADARERGAYYIAARGAPCRWDGMGWAVVPCPRYRTAQRVAGKDGQRRGTRFAEEEGAPGCVLQVSGGRRLCGYCKTPTMSARRRIAIHVSISASAGRENRGSSPHRKARMGRKQELRAPLTDSFPS
ncbi:hypothetical protein C8J57DRAFT_1374328 [Mycena rebaudengoi]|nr:hypothetical protein C8J57DRAFT_1374328 [Mycena rebaudengoi]